MVDSPAELRSAYRSTLLRIAAADLTKAAGVDETMHRLSQLADATMAAALRLAEQERGASPRLAVIAMGKCGGRELNYVSDVDVIFVCDSDPDLAEAQVVAARMMQICGQAAWQVDAEPAAGRQPGSASTDARLPSRLLRPVGPDVGVAGAAQGATGGAG
jgi:glutamate-ammonia-ligase adenylyltransferase